MLRTARAAAWQLFVLLFLVSAAHAQKPVPITPADYGKWETLGAGALSPDGKWLAYPITRDNGEDELRLRSLTGDSTKVVAYGSRPLFSDDSRWLAYSIGVSEAEREKAEKAKKPVKNKMGLVELATGKTVTVTNVASFQFSDGGAYLAMRGRSGSPKASPSSTGKRSSSRPRRRRAQERERRIEQG